MKKKIKKKVDQSSEDLLQDEDEEEEEPEEEEESPEEDLDEEDEDEEDVEPPSKKKKKASKKASDEASEEDDDETDEEDAEDEEEEEEQEEESFLPGDLDLKDLDPKLRKVLTQIDGRMKSAFNKKMTAFSESNKGKKVIASFDDLLQDKEFVAWANQQMANRGPTGPQDVTKISMDEAVQHWATMGHERQTAYMTKLSPSDRELFKLKLTVYNNQVQNYRTMESKAESDMITAHGDVYKALSPKVEALRREIYKEPFVSKEEAFKILDYTDYGKRQYKLGLIRGQKLVKKKKKNSIPSHQESSSRSFGKKKKKPGSIREAYEQAEESEA